MPRQARIISNSGIYHIMIRGINKEQIFKNETKKIKMKEIIRSTTSYFRSKRRTSKKIIKYRNNYL